MLRRLWIALPLLSCSVVRDLSDLRGTADGGAGGTGGTAGAAGTGLGGDGGATMGPGGSAGAGLGGGGAGGTGAGGGQGACGSFDGPGPGGAPAGAIDTLGEVGCSDGSRELFMDRGQYPDVAGCSGGFSEPGIVSPASLAPQCDRSGGNDGDRPFGWGCSVEDLCSVGWHVCVDATELGDKSSTGTCATDAVGFWSTRQSQTMGSECSADGVNNLVGCGAFFGDVPPASCDPLNLELREFHCQASCAWICDVESSFNEAEYVQKYGSVDGGVVCCRD